MNDELWKTPLYVEDLDVSYPGTEVLRQVSLRVEPGEVYGLLGRNGAGKTTLLNTLMRLVEPTGGRIRLWGWPHARAPTDRVWRRISYLGEMAGVLPHWRVRRVLTFQKHCYGRIRQDWVERLLDEYKIPPRALMRQLSRGQQQMVGLILSVAVEPDLLLLDEPAAGLDPVARRELLGSVLELMGDRRAATLITSHILSDIERIVDRVGFLAGGRIALEGRLDDLKEQCALVRLEPYEEVPEGVMVLRKRPDGTLLVSGDLVRLPPERMQALGLEELYVEFLRDD